MKQIELTDEQTSELLNLLMDRIVSLTRGLRDADEVETVELQHQRHVLSEIEHLLEIA
jgi:hypothetical protein